MIKKIIITGIRKKKVKIVRIILKVLIINENAN